MLVFDGLTQIKSKEPTNTGGLLLTCVHCRRPTKISYSGSEPFDLFQITVFNNKKSQLVEQLEEGDIIYVRNGRMFSYTKIISNKRYWFSRFGVDILDITIVARAEPPPDFNDHLDLTGQDNSKGVYEDNRRSSYPDNSG